jgi:hypothetical protein
MINLLQIVTGEKKCTLFEKPSRKSKPNMKQRVYDPHLKQNYQAKLQRKYDRNKGYSRNPSILPN